MVHGYGGVARQFFGIIRVAKSVSIVTFEAIDNIVLINGVLAMADTWRCPYCNCSSTLQSDNMSQGSGLLSTTPEGIDGNLGYLLGYVVCAAEGCQQYSIIIDFFDSEPLVPRGFDSGPIKRIFSHRIRPRGIAKPFPDYIPKAIIQTYKEACLIIDDSPMASATLARRCLQGIIKDFFSEEVEERDYLKDQLLSVQNKFSPLTWKAIDSLRESGNIGAHIKNVNEIVDVKPGESEALIQLIELLLSKTYISKYEEEGLLNRVILNTKKQKTQEKGEGNQEDG